MFYIKTKDGVSIIEGDNMFIDGDYLYVYKGQDLYGMYLVANVVEAHRTVKK